MGQRSDWLTAVCTERGRHRPTHTHTHTELKAQGLICFVCLSVSLFPPVSLCVHSFTRSRSRWGMLWTLTSSETQLLDCVLFLSNEIYPQSDRQTTNFPLLVEQRRYFRFWVWFPFLVRLFISKQTAENERESVGREKSGPFDLSLCWFSFFSLSRLLGLAARRFVNL